MIPSTIHEVPGESRLAPIVSPSISLVVPCLNESAVIGEFVEWCKEGLARLGRPGQILIVDSSTDNSAQIARDHGAEVLVTPKRGLGQAYRDALPHIRGQYVVMGDCDLTYDFRELAPIIAALDEGADFVMGSRLSGTIDPGAMPWLHRYFGTPLTTWILNVVYGTRYTDIHCGLRAITRRKLQEMSLESTSWEYASEMVLKASLLGLKMKEVPIAFYKDRGNRVSHHKRMGWISPWLAGWNNLKITLTYSPDFFLIKPGVISLIIGLLLAASLIRGPYHLGPILLSLHCMLLGTTLATIGYSALQLGILARLYYNFRPERSRRISAFVTYERGMVTTALLGVTGLIFIAPMLVDWIHSGFRLSGIVFPGVFGLTLLILAFQTFTFTLLIQMISRQRHRMVES